MKKQLIILVVIALVLFLLGLTIRATENNNQQFDQVSWKKIYTQHSCNATSTDGLHTFSIEWMPTGASPFGEPHQYVLKDIKNNSRTILKVKNETNPCALEWAESGLYVSEMIYEHIGQLELVDQESLFKGNLVTHKINGFGDGFISPDGQWYLFATNTDKGDGLEYCADELTRKSQSSLRILNFLTGKIYVIAEDKNKVFDIGGWSPDSKYVLFREFTLKDHPQCPEISGSGLGSASIYSLIDQRLIRVSKLDITR